MTIPEICESAGVPAPEENTNRITRSREFTWKGLEEELKRRLIRLLRDTFGKSAVRANPLAVFLRLKV